MSGAAGQVREALGRIESKLDSAADDIRRLVVSHESAEAEKINELLEVVRELRAKLKTVYDDGHTPNHRRMIAFIAAGTSFIGFIWAFAQPLYVEFISHVRFQW